MSRQQHTLMRFCPATGETTPYPSHARQWREFNGSHAWLFNPWTGEQRGSGDVGDDPFGLLILPPGEPVCAATSTVTKMWLWKNFVDGRPEYWAFNNPFPIHMDNGDPQTLGEPCGYALYKESRIGRTDASEEEVLRRIAAVRAAQAGAGKGE